MFRPISVSGLKRVALGEGVCEFSQDYIGASICGPVFGAFGVGIGVSQLQFYGGLGDTGSQMDMSLYVVYGTFILFGVACLLPSLFGFGRRRKIVFDRGAGRVKVRTRTWFVVSERDCPYSAALLELHERWRLTGRKVFKDYVLMVQVAGRSYYIGRKLKRSAADSLAEETGAQLGLPFSWSDERVIAIV